MAEVGRPTRESATARGRPSTYSETLAAAILERLACGESLRAICATDGMPDKATILRWLARDAGFRARYEVARQLQRDTWIDEIVDLSRAPLPRDPRTGRVDAVAAAHARNRGGTLRWLVLKLRPRKCQRCGGIGDAAEYAGLQAKLATVRSESPATATRDAAWQRIGPSDATGVAPPW